MRTADETLDDLELLIRSFLSSRNFEGVKQEEVISEYAEFACMLMPYIGANMFSEDLDTLYFVVKNFSLGKIEMAPIALLGSLRELALRDGRLDYIDKIKDLCQFMLPGLDELSPYLDPKVVTLFFLITTVHEIRDKYPSSFDASVITPEVLKKAETFMEYYQKNEFKYFIQSIRGIFLKDRAQYHIEKLYPLDEPSEERDITDRMLVLCREGRLREVVDCYLFLSNKGSDDSIYFCEAILHTLLNYATLDVENTFEILRGMLRDEKSQTTMLENIVLVILLSLPISYERIIFFIKNILEEFCGKEKDGRYLKELAYLLGANEYKYPHLDKKTTYLASKAIAMRLQGLDAIAQKHGSIFRVFFRMIVRSVLAEKGNFDEQWIMLYEKMRAHYSSSYLLDIALLKHSDKITSMISLLGKRDFFYYMNRVEHLQFFDELNAPFYLASNKVFFQHISEDPILVHWKYIAEAPFRVQGTLIDLNKQDYVFVQQYCSLVEEFNAKKALENIQWATFFDRNLNGISFLFNILGPKAIDFIRFFMNEPAEEMEKLLNNFYKTLYYDYHRNAFLTAIFPIVKEIFSEKKYQALTLDEMVHWHAIFQYQRSLIACSFRGEKITEFCQKIKPLLRENLTEALTLLKRFPLDFFSSQYIKFSAQDDFIELYKKFDRINTKHEDAFQQREINYFFSVHNKKIVMLVDIMGISALKWLGNQLAKTVLSLERLLDELPGNLPEPMHEFFKRYFSIHKSEILTKEEMETWKNIMIAIKTVYDIFERLRLKSQAWNFQRYDETFFSDYKGCERLPINDFSIFCRQKLFDEMVKSMEITGEEAKRINSDILFSILSPAQFAQLAKAKLNISTTDNGKVLHELINCYFRGASIYAFLHDESQVSLLGRGLASHNRRIQNILAERGVKIREAISYSKTYEFTLIPKSFHAQTKKIRAMEYLCGFLHKLCSSPDVTQSPINVVIRHLQDKRAAIVDALKRTPDSLTLPRQKRYIDEAIKELRDIQKQYKQVFKDNKNPVELYRDTHWDMLMAIQASLKQVIDLKVVDNQSETKSFFEFAEHYQEAYASDAMEKVIVVPKTDRIALQHFRIEQWDKEKIMTLFLGNEVGCCLAVGNTHFSAIVQRIMDDAMQFHVVVDLETQKPIALTWLYFGKDVDNNIYLIGNFIEINAKYGLNDYARETIVNALLHFSGELYCRDVNIPEFIINQLMYGYNAGKIGYFSQKVVHLRDKVGGPFVPETTNRGYYLSGAERQGCTCDRYYLASLQASLNGNYSFHCYNPNALTTEQRAAFESIEDRIEKIVQEHFLAHKAAHSDFSDEAIFDAILPKIREFVISTAGVFFDNNINSEKLTAILERARRIVLERENSQAGQTSEAPTSFGKNRNTFFAGTEENSGASVDQTDKSPDLPGPPEAS